MHSIITTCLGRHLRVAFVFSETRVISSTSGVPLKLKKIREIIYKQDASDIGEIVLNVSKTDSLHVHAFLITRAERLIYQHERRLSVRVLERLQPKKATNICTDISLADSI